MAITETMIAVVLHGADDMRVEPRPMPQPGPGEVLLKVEVASICGTDCAEYRSLAEALEKPPGTGLVY